MDKVPDSPEKAIEYVLTFLPGFVALGLFVYMTDAVFGDLTFTYVAVTLSLLIYLLAHPAQRLLTRWAHPSSRGAAVITARVLSILVLTVAVSVALIVLYESQAVISLVRSVSPTFILKSSQRSPLVGLIAADTRHLLHDVDDRPAVHRIAKTAEGNIAPYSLYVRVQVGEGQVFEGRPVRFATGKSETGLPILLSPACRVLQPGETGERVGRIYGPGVLVTGEDLKYVELFEMKASKCWQCFHGDAGTFPEAQCVNVAAPQSAAK